MTLLRFGAARRSRALLNAGLAAGVAAASVSCHACCKPIEWGGGVDIASELFEHGLRVAGSGPAVQANVAAWFVDDWSASASVAAQRDGIGRAVLRAGHSWNFSDDWQLQAGLARYEYPDVVHSKWRRTEARASVSYRDVASLEFALERHPEHRQWRPAADAALRWPVGDSMSLVASVGFARVPSAWRQTYEHGSLGAAWQQGPWHASVSRIFLRISEGSYAFTPASRWALVVGRDL